MGVPFEPSRHFSEVSASFWAKKRDGNVPDGPPHSLDLPELLVCADGFVVVTVAAVTPTPFTKSRWPCVVGVVWLLMLVGWFGE